MNNRSRPDVGRHYPSIPAALADLTMPDDIASAGYLERGNGYKYPSVIRIRRDGGGTGSPGFLVIFADNVLSCRHCFENIDELTTIVEPGLGEDPTYAQAAASIIEQFNARIG